MIFYFFFYFFLFNLKKKKKNQADQSWAATCGGAHETVVNRPLRKELQETGSQKIVYYIILFSWNLCELQVKTFNGHALRSVQPDDMAWSDTSKSLIVVDFQTKVVNQGGFICKNVRSFSLWTLDWFAINRQTIESDGFFNSIPTEHLHLSVLLKHLYY